MGTDGEHSLGVDLKALEDLLKCSVWLEERTAELYASLAEKLISDSTRSLMKVIAAQSRAHAEALRAVMKFLGVDEEGVSEERCAELTKPVGPLTKDLLMRVTRLREAGLKEYLQVLNDLKFLESGISEETYMRVLQPLLKSVLLELKKGDLGKHVAWEVREAVVNELVKDIVRQEALHESLVRKASEVLKSEEEPGGYG